MALGPVGRLMSLKPTEAWVAKAHGAAAPSPPRGMSGLGFILIVMKTRGRALRTRENLGFVFKMTRLLLR